MDAGGLRKGLDQKFKETSSFCETLIPGNDKVLIRLALGNYATQVSDLAATDRAKVYTPLMLLLHSIMKAGHVGAGTSWQDIVKTYYKDEEQIAAMQAKGLRLTGVDFYRESLVSTLKQAGVVTGVSTTLSGDAQTAALGKAFGLGIQYLLALGEAQWKEKPVEFTGSTPEAALSWYGHIVTEGRQFSG